MQLKLLNQLLNSGILLALHWRTTKLSGDPTLKLHVATNFDTDLFENYYNCSILFLVLIVLYHFVFHYYELQNTG